MKTYVAGTFVPGQLLSVNRPGGLFVDPFTFDTMFSWIKCQDVCVFLDLKKTWVKVLCREGIFFVHWMVFE